MPSQSEIGQAALASLKRDVRKLGSPELDQLVENTRFIDLADIYRLSNADVKALLTAIGRPADLKDWSDRQIVYTLRGGGSILQRNGIFPQQRHYIQFQICRGGKFRPGSGARS